MKDFSSQTFRYDGKKYTFQVTLRTYDGDMEVTLDNQGVTLFEYESELNNLIQRGSIEYTDSYGSVDKFLEKSGSYCEVLFVQNEQSFDGPLTIEKLSDTNRFFCMFLIENIGITGRRSNQVDYKIDLVSGNACRCGSNIDFSNYGQEPQPVFDIFKACLAQAKLPLDEDSFSRVKTGVKMNYVTNGNDDILSVQKYLFSRLYYYAQKDTSLKFTFWNETTNKVHLFDITDKQTSTGVYSVILSLLKSKHESLVQEEQNKIATVTRMPTTKNLRSVSDTFISDYNYETNRFVTAGVTSKSIVGYFNKTFDSEDKLLCKQQPVGSGMNYIRRGSYWNNDFDCYGDMVKVLSKNNALLVETSGEILRKPSSMVDVAVDRDVSEIPTEDHKQFDDMMTRYRGIEGMWFASRVHHYVYPAQGRYRQWLALVRNFTIDLDNKKS